MYYGLYPVDTDVSEFTAVAYQAEIILRLATKPKMGWYARNMAESQKPNRTIGYMGPTRRLITHQATSWTHQLYKDTDTRRDTQRLHHPHPTTPMKTTAVTDAMKICLFCDTSDTSGDDPIHYLHGDSIHLHVHCSNTNIQQTRDASNVDIATALQHLGALIQHSPYTRRNACVTFQAFLSTRMHQYDINTTHHTTTVDPDGDHPYHHTTTEPRAHRSITSLGTA